MNVFQCTPLKTTCIPAGFEWTFTKRPTAYPSFRTQNVHMPAGFEWTFTKRPPAYPNFRTQNYLGLKITFGEDKIGQSDLDHIVETSHRSVFTLLIVVVLLVRKSWLFVC